MPSSIRPNSKAGKDSGLITGKRGIALGVVLIVSIAAAFSILAESEEPELAVVEMGDVDFAFVEKGVIRAAREVVLYATLNGEVAWVAESGTDVRAGDVVVRMTNSDIDNALEAQRLEHEHARRAERKAVADLRAFDTSSQIEVEIRRLELEKRHWQLERLYRENRVSKVKQAEYDLAKAKLDLERAKNNEKTSRRLFEESIISKAELEAAENAMKKAEVRYEKSREIFNTLKSGANEKRIEEAKKAVDEAIQNLNLAKRERTNGLMIRRQEVQKARQHLSKSQIRLNRLTEEKAGEAVTSPIDGTVILYDIWKGSSAGMEPLKVGDHRRASWDLLKIADTTNLIVKCSINEADCGRIATGLPVEIEMTSLPGRTYRGTVAEIGAFMKDKNLALGGLALKRSGLAFNGVAEVEIRFADADRDVLLGHGVTVRFRLGKKECLTLPVSAVRVADGETYVLMADGSRRVIATGLCGQDRVEIASGLERGEEVFVGDAR